MQTSVEGGVIFDLASSLFADPAFLAQADVLDPKCLCISYCTYISPFIFDLIVNYPKPREYKAVLAKKSLIQPQG